MHLPNYKDGSIVNLMSSIKKAFGGRSSYQQLKNFDTSDISKKNIVLIIVDGLGYEYLLKYGKESFLYKNLRGKITSVLPSTTASAMTSFMTGVAPGQHALTGWFMYLKELGIVARTLPFESRAGNLKLEEGKIKFEDIYKEKSFFEDLKVSSFYIGNKKYIDSQYTQTVTKGARKLAFSNINEFFKKINSALDKKGRKFIFAYWAEFDSICHRKGIDSTEAKKHFEMLDKKIAILSKSLKNKNTAIIITADHGLIDTKEKSRFIKLENHPKFIETLSMPLSGEPRFAYCYVKPSKIKQFENYVKTEFKDVCSMHKSSYLIKKNYFGLFESSENLKDRVGDYVLIMKEDYVMKDLVFGEDRNIFIGNHGGTSKEEMFVPLVVID